MAIHAASSDLTPTPVLGYDLFHATLPFSEAFERIHLDTEQNLDKEFLVWTHTLPNHTNHTSQHTLPNQANQTSQHTLPNQTNQTGDVNYPGNILHLFDIWLRNGESEIFLRDPFYLDNASLDGRARCLYRPCSSEEMCRPRIRCLFDTLLDGTSHTQRFSSALKNTSFNFNLDLCRDSTTGANWWIDNFSGVVPFSCFHTRRTGTSTCPAETSTLNLRLQTGNTKT